MSIKASKLKSNESQKVSLNKEINAILGHIDDSLKVAYEQGKHNISLTIPITFSIPYINKYQDLILREYILLIPLIIFSFSFSFLI